MEGKCYLSSLRYGFFQRRMQNFENVGAQIVGNMLVPLTVRVGGAHHAGENFDK